MSEPFLAEIRIFAGNFAPRDWALCDGQLLSINQNQSLYSLLGTTYGGDGRTSFALPDLRGRLAMHAGDGPGLSSYQLGAKGGTEHVTLTTNQIPSHNHGVESISAIANQPKPAAHLMATEQVPLHDLYSDLATDGDMKASMIKNTGGSNQHENRQPYQAVNYIIALRGLFPSRN